jgi:CheY-like chemotaxis protein
MQKITVLIADDHTIVRRGLRSLLQTENDIEVVGEAETGRQAVQTVVGGVLAGRSDGDNTCSASLDVDEELWRAVVTPNALAVIRAERDQWIDTRRPSSWNPARRCCRQRQLQRGSRNGRGLVDCDLDELIAGDFEFQQPVWLEAGRRFAGLCETAPTVCASGSEASARLISSLDHMLWRGLIVL